MNNYKKAYLYTKKNNLKDIISFFEVYEDFHINKIKENFLEITFEKNINLNVFIEARDFVMVELFKDFTVFIAPNELGLSVEEIFGILPELSFGVYDIKLLIIELLFLNKANNLSCIRDYYYNHFSKEILDTVFGFINQDLNASKAAKVLFMHRNTLNYRLDNFIKRTEIDIRTFKGALAFYLLFKR